MRCNATLVDSLIEIVERDKDKYLYIRIYKTRQIIRKISPDARLISILITSLLISATTHFFVTVLHASVASRASDSGVISEGIAVSRNSDHV